MPYDLVTFKNLYPFPDTRKITMKISFDNLRKNIAYDFNEVAAAVEILETAKSDHDVLRGLDGLKRDLNVLRGSLGGLLSCYDSEQTPDDFNDLSGEIELLEL